MKKWKIRISQSDINAFLRFFSIYELSSQQTPPYVDWMATMVGYETYGTLIGLLHARHKLPRKKNTPFACEYVGVVTLTLLLHSVR